MLTTHRVLGLILLATPLLWADAACAGWASELAVVNKSAPDEALAGLKVSGTGPENGARAAGVEIRKPSRSTSSPDPARAPNRAKPIGLQAEGDQAAKARRSLEQAAAGTSPDPKVFLTFGNLALSEGRYSDARLNYERALSLLSGTSLDVESIRAIRREGSAGLATASESIENWASALAHFRAWLEIEPTNASARQRLGRVLFSLGKTEEAYNELSRAAKDDPKLGPAAIPMALLFVRAGNDLKAEEWFIYASKVEPRSAVVRLTHAQWRLDKGRVAEARSLAEEASKLDPGAKEIDALRGIIALQLRDLITAERIFETLYRVAPTEPGYGALLTLALVDQDDSEKRSRGLRLAEDNIKKFPNALDVQASLARAHDRSGHRDEAERLIRDTIARAGGQATPTVAYFLAQILAEKGQTDQAIDLLTQAVATPVAFAYQSEAEKLLASLKRRTPAAAAPGTNQGHI